MWKRGNKVTNLKDVKIIVDDTKLQVAEHRPVILKNNEKIDIKADRKFSVYFSLVNKSGHLYVNYMNKLIPVSKIYELIRKEK